MNPEMLRIVQQSLDRRLLFLREAQSSAQKPVRGWLRAVRDALDLSQNQVATKLGIKRQSYADLERTEARGSITVNSLAKAADSMDCELVYFLVPRKSVARTFGELARIHDPLFAHRRATEHSMALEGQSVGDLTKP
jgi:predicted DNA-binding mobile mystery protein A